MRNCINKNSRYILLWLALGAAACSGEKKEKEPHPSAEQLLQTVSTVTAVGKVVPETGFISVSSPVAGKIEHIKVKEGDPVEKGQLLIQLSAQDAALSIQQSKARSNTLKAQHASDAEDLKAEQVKLQELEQTYQTTLALFNQHAETRERLQQDETAWKQQQLRVQSLTEKIKANKLSQKEQSLEIDLASNTYNDLQVTAAASGILYELNAQLGQTVTMAETLGSIADTSALIVEAEVDELMADKVKVGQEVQLYYVGRREDMGTGTVSYVGAGLMNKSVLYETPGEASDRRVRRIKIKPKSSNAGFLLNAKLECKIAIK